MSDKAIICFIGIVIATVLMNNRNKNAKKMQSECEEEHPSVDADVQVEEPPLDASQNYVSRNNMGDDSCMKCKQKMGKNCFSKSQWKKGQGNRTCIDCIRETAKKQWCQMEYCKNLLYNYSQSTVCVGCKNKFSHLLEDGKKRLMSVEEKVKDFPNANLLIQEAKLLFYKDLHISFVLREYPLVPAQMDEANTCLYNAYQIIRFLDKAYRVSWYYKDRDCVDQACVDEMCVKKTCYAMLGVREMKHLPREIFEIIAEYYID
jgi:hypothetical protein